MRNKYVVVLIVFVFAVPVASLGAEPVSMARLEYDGGGDWYNNPDVIPNLMGFVHEETGMSVNTEQTVVRATDDELFQHPILYVTGHGNIRFSEEERRSLRNYVRAGGFIYIDDDYGMDEAARREIRRLFPDQPFRRLSMDHPLLNNHFSFNNWPRIHEHDPEEPPAFYGIRVDRQWVLLYTHNTNVSDGWASPEVHGDPPEVRRRALRMGVNIVKWVLAP